MLHTCKYCHKVYGNGEGCNIDGVGYKFCSPECYLLSKRDEIATSVTERIFDVIDYAKQYSGYRITFTMDPNDVYTFIRDNLVVALEECESGTKQTDV